jgi:predicted nuclease with RNAse H fold
MKLAGIDFGAKLAGTTVVCVLGDEAELIFFSSAKKQDADIFLINVLEEIKPDLLALDAPLSLPLRYIKKDNNGSFFYRKADIETGAMSPMFLGGLTARAMQLHAHLLSMGIEVDEAYPAQLAKILKLPDAYKKENEALPVCNEILRKYWENELQSIKLHKQAPQNWHEFDAWLALTIAFRKKNKLAKSYGLAEEGLIWA